MSANEFSPLGSRIFNQYEGGRPEKDCLESAGNALSLFAKTAFGRDVKIGKELKETTAPCALRIIAGIVAVILAPITFIGLLLTRLSPTHAKANSIANKILRKQNKNTEKPVVQKDPRESIVQGKTTVPVENKPAVVQQPVSKDNSPESDQKNTQDEAASQQQAVVVPVVETKEPSPAPATTVNKPTPVALTTQTAAEEVKAPSPRPTSPRPQNEQILVGEGADLRPLFDDINEETTTTQAQTTVTIDSPVEKKVETEGTETQEEVVEGDVHAKPEIEEEQPGQVDEEIDGQDDASADRAILTGPSDTEPLDNATLPEEIEEDAENDSVNGDDCTSERSDTSGESVNVHDLGSDGEGSVEEGSDESSNSGESEGDSE